MLEFANQLLCSEQINHAICCKERAKRKEERKRQEGEVSSLFNSPQLGFASSNASIQHSEGRKRWLHTARFASVVPQEHFAFDLCVSALARI